MTCQHQCEKQPCPHPELCAEFGAAHAILTLMTWLCIVVLMLICWVFSVIYSDESGAALKGIVDAAKNIF